MLDVLPVAPRAIPGFILFIASMASSSDGRAVILSLVSRLMYSGLSLLMTEKSGETSLRLNSFW
jgi:hypothetical protein